MRIREVVQRQALHDPDRIALSAGDTTLTYALLAQRSEHLAALLRERGVGPGEIVAVLVEPGPDLLIALLATVRAGAAYLPLDPAHPSGRLSTMVTDAGVRVLVTSTALAARIEPATGVVLLLDDLPTTAEQPSAVPETVGSVDDPFYVIYTSGSTGTPKGALLHERGIRNQYDHYAREHGTTADSRYLVVSSVGFDLTQKNLWVPLMHGATVVLTGQQFFDPAAILATIERERVTHLNCTPSAFHALLDGAGETEWQQLASLEIVQLGGEAVHAGPLQEWWQNPHNRATLINGYGPTECSAVVTTHVVAAGEVLPDPVPIGTPIPGVEVHVVDDELLVSGIGVGLGYLNRPELTAERFITLPGVDGPVYRTGDRVRRTPAGLLEYAGRTDDQVKVNGQRIELGEIEATLLQHPSVQSVACAVRGGRLCTWLVASGEVADAGDFEPVRARLREQLPDAMIPTQWQWIDALPLTVHGKVDRAALPEPTRQRPDVGTPHAAPRGPLEEHLAALWRDVLGLDSVGRNDPFFDLGGTSLHAIQVVNRLRHELDVQLPVAGLFAAPTVQRYAELLAGEHAAAISEKLGFAVAAEPKAVVLKNPERDRSQLPTREPIAIVGMHVRVPGADSIEDFWQNLHDGVESIRDLTDAELDAAGVSADERNDADYVRRVAVCDDADTFDAAFFGYTAREAALLDPQQRLLLESSWAALEQAGLDPTDPGGRVGVFAGVARNSYFQVNLATNPRTRGTLTDVSVTFGNDKDYAATRIAHKLDFRGPALTAQTACSTGGVLLHLARQSLQTGETDTAVVAGSRIVTPLTAGYPWIDGSIFSSDGRMRVFDADGSGMVRGSGAVVLVLKRLSDAQRDGDTIHAVLRGTALNNDGADKVGYTAPSVPGQAEVIRMALADADVSADSISYIEAHGTGTRLGDPIELTALNQAFRLDTDRVGFCRIGSVKSNVGHLDPAAALVGVVKTALALQHRQVPPTLHYTRANPEIPLDGSPFVVADHLVEWTGEAPLRAGVSSFGIGGTNAHLILEEAPAATAVAPAARDWQLLPLSARTPEALDASRERLASRLADPSVVLADAAATLQTGRARLGRRGFVVARDGATAGDGLRGDRFVQADGGDATEVVFVFPGQGSQHPEMARALYDGEPLFRDLIDRGCAHLEPLLGVDLRTILYPAPGGADAAADALRQTGLTQPAIYLISYATARLWESWGIAPAAMIGHSVGEFVAATLAGVFGFEDALTVLAARARLMQEMPSGSMLAIRLSEGETRAVLPDNVSVAAINSAKLTIVSGPDDAIAALAEDLTGRDIAVVALHTSHAFHSAMMDPVLDEFRSVVASVPRNAPSRTIVSTLTNEILTAEQAQDPDYWARQLRETVRFAPAVAEAVKTPGRVLLEIGPGQSLAGPLRQSSGGAPCVSSLPPAAQDDADAMEHLLGALGRLWIAGIRPDWAALHGGPRARVSLPTYPFARTRHWIEAGDTLVNSGTPELESPVLVGETAPDAAPTNAIADRALAVIADITGEELSADERTQTFLELGMDSLLLTQVTGKLKAAFKVNLRFRQLLEELNTPERLLAWLTENADSTAAAATATTTANDDAGVATDDSGQPFGAAVRIERPEHDVLSPAQRRSMDQLIERYVARTPQSKAATAQHRGHFADPRTVSGFRPMWKESVYPIVTTRSDGAHVWDVDGNQYIDTVNGFGATMFGHRPPFVDQALKDQIDRGYEVGPVQDFLGDLAERFTRMVHLDRVAFCNTGSEAVSAAQRCARTVTGKDLIASFTGDYHGIHDEVIVRPGPNGKGLPAASGIPAAHTSQTLILEYGDPEALKVLEARMDELAAIMIEPIQSRNQDFQPREFIHALRDIATRAGCALIMDEVITGFRLAPGGAQEHFGVKADLATYGKVFGGGLPVGAVAGIPQFMDALDGGAWEYGDDSAPEVGVTFFAGTFVRHPLAMAASLATLKHLEANPGIQADLNARTADLVARLKTAIGALKAPVRVTSYTSIFRFEASQDEPFFELLAHYFRLNGIHTYDHRNQVMTTAHTPEVMDAMLTAYVGAIEQMQHEGLLGTTGEPVRMGLADHRPGARWYAAPAPDARLGRNRQGNPRWYVPDTEAPAGWRELEEAR